MEYQELLAAAQHDPAEADFHALRMAYVRSSAYAPYAHDEEHVEVLNAALPAGDLDAALEAIQGLLDTCYLDIEAHMAADYVYTMQHQQAESAYHRAWATGLIRAILATGDGRGYDTAYIVLSIPEEYTLLRVMGLRPDGQRLEQHAGHWFDVLNATHTESGRPLQVFFNVDLPRGWLERNVGGVGEN
jgi:hypothetical protein